MGNWRVRKYMHTLDRLGLVVRQERTALNLSTWQLARAADVTHKFIRRLESGHANPDLAGVRRVLDSLGVKPLMLPGELARK